MATPLSSKTFDPIEHLTRLNRMQADTNGEHLDAGHVPWQLALFGIGTGAAFIAVGAALAKFLS